MGLFDKKFCDICGNKIGLLGNRKLDDGNLCKDCAAKLSPWFTERRSSTVAGIKDQLAYREANKAEVDKFNTTRTVGKGMKVYIDEAAGKFMVSRNNPKNENADVLCLSAVTGVLINVDEDSKEIMKKTADGKEESYIPKKFEYSYSIDITINVNNPFFNEIKFVVENGIDIEVNGMAKPSPMQSVDYQEAMNIANEIKSVLLDTPRENAAKAAAPKVAVTCPCCGATTIPNAQGCCEYCGGAIG